MSNVQQAQIKNNKGELIGELRGKSVTTTIKEITPFGVRISNNGTGQFTGKYTASVMDTVNVSLNRDGTTQYETKSIQNTMEGDFVIVNSTGHGKSTGPTTQEFEGEVAFMTQSQKLAWLNTTKGWIEGTTNNATGEYQAKIYAQK
ncbi:MAG: hypothetical protein OK474_01475 [Thaumarchaeota archaeon]|nr:hypothetical protein [Nitrososphaerota archaeon]